MAFPALIEPRDEQYAASLVGAPEVAAFGASRGAALAALEALLTQRIDRGQLACIEVSARGLLQLAGKYTNDPTLRDICREAYAERDRQRDELDVAGASAPSASPTVPR